MSPFRRSLTFMSILLLVNASPFGSVSAQTPTSSDQLTPDICLSNTHNEGECKDCCDSLETDGAARKACRDTCPSHDFTQNMSFVTVNAPSVLGANGDYSSYTASGDERTCKDSCDASTTLQSGDRRFCRDACAQLSGGDNPATPQPGGDNPPPPPGEGNPPPQPGGNNPPPPSDGNNTNPPNGQQHSPAMNIDQALSEEAQRNTIAFSALAYLTGDFNADTFFPPGKVADMWGFQYLRDNDPSGMGHNTDFLTYASLNMLTVLTAEQRAELQALAQSQVEAINQYAVMRFVLIDAFRRNLNGDLPAGTTGLSLEAVQAYSAELYRLDGKITLQRAEVMSRILNALTADQRATLDTMVGTGMTSWNQPEEPADLRGLEHDVKVNVMTYAGDMFSWYAGSIEADTYINPERQGTYFGAFYLKDAPAVGNPGYIISSTLTADMGQAFLETLTEDQRALINEIVELELPYLQDIVKTRTAISTELRRSLNGETIDADTVLALMETYGQDDGAVVYTFARNFALVNATLTDDQRAQLMALRSQMLGNLVPEQPFLYSQTVAMPEIPNTDFLFQ